MNKVYLESCCFKQNRRTLLCIAVFCLNHAEGKYIRRVQNKNLPEREDFLVILMTEHCPPGKVGFCSYYSDRRSCFFQLSNRRSIVSQTKLVFAVIMPKGRRLTDDIF